MRVMGLIGRWWFKGLCFIVGALLAGLLQQIYLSWNVVPAKITGFDLRPLPDGDTRVVVYAQVAHNTRCSLNGSHVLVSGSRIMPLGDANAGGIFRASGDRVEYWLSLKPDVDLALWRYQYRTWYTCNPLGLIHWARGEEKWDLITKTRAP